MAMTMAMATSACKGVLLMAFVAATTSLAGSLQYDFYRSSCPKAEEAVRNATQEIILKDPTMGAAFMRLFFHDCFVKGCDASILLDRSNSNPQPEKIAIPLRGYDAVNKIKAAVEAVCPGVVSCADILAFAARDSAIISGSFGFAMPAGRRDGLNSSTFDVGQGIPSPSFQVQDLIKSFAAKGLSAVDLVALSGAHSFGQTHCSFVTGRLYPTVDPTMNATFAEALKKVCPPPSSGGGGRVLNNNRVTDPNEMSNQYYSNLNSKQVLFTSDQTLLSSNETAKMVKENADNPIAWMARFAGALVNMGKIEVLTGTAGEVRKVCNATNSGS
ncbi:peroxidase 2-like [Phragmites australis]|uniref:peroxidase 2-like n=1 Tax=Phragmites australis TaxID=29695 RepID=UPI002D7998B4|nr:peroxidase 2-like [Phragmites australis]